MSRALALIRTLSCWALFAAVPAAAATVSFTSNRLYPAGSVPATVAVGDFNGNGILDLAVSNSGDNTIGIFLGNGDGTFQPRQNYPSGGVAPTGLVVADLRGKGLLDLAVSNSKSNTVAVLWGNGDGTFQAPQLYGTRGMIPQTLAFGDFTGNGQIDLVVPNSGSNNVAVLLNKGDGTFQVLPPFSSAWMVDPQTIAVGDFNGNGILDLAVADQGSDRVSIFLGDGQGGFKFYVDALVGASPNSVAVGDFNGNGILDLAVANQGSNSVTVLFGNGQGGFSGRSDYSVGKTPQRLSVGDVTGNGQLDILTPNSEGGSISLLLGEGQGKFAPASHYFILPGADGTQLQPSSIALGAFQSGGRTDLVVACHAAAPTALNALLVMLQAPPGTASSPVRPPVGRLPAPRPALP